MDPENPVLRTTLRVWLEPQHNPPPRGQNTKPKTVSQKQCGRQVVPFAASQLITLEVDRRTLMMSTCKSKQTNNPSVARRRSDLQIRSLHSIKQSERAEYGAELAKLKQLKPAMVRSGCFAARLADPQLQHDSGRRIQGERRSFACARLPLLRISMTGSGSTLGRRKTSSATASRRFTCGRSQLV